MEIVTSSDIFNKGILSEECYSQQDRQFGCVWFDDAGYPRIWLPTWTATDNGEINDHAYTWGIAPVSEQDQDDSVAMDIVYFDIVQAQIDREHANVFVPVPIGQLPVLDDVHPEECEVCDEGRDCLDLEKYLAVRARQ